MFSSAPGRTRAGRTTGPLTPWCATDTGLKVGRLFWEQDIGRFDSYVSDDLDLRSREMTVDPGHYAEWRRGSAAGS